MVPNDKYGAKLLKKFEIMAISLKKMSICAI